MHMQDLLTSTNIRSSNKDFAVKSSRTHDRRIQNINTVGRCHHDNTLVDTKTIHLDQHLVQGLLTLVMSAAHTGSASSCYGIDLIDKDDTRRILLCLCKKVTHTGCTDTYKHFNKIRSRNTEKRHACLSGNCLGKQSLTGSRRSD